MVKAMQADQPLPQPHAHDFWLARGAIVVTAFLNAILINHLTIIPSWLSSLFELALLIPLSVATAWTQNRVRKATTKLGILLGGLTFDFCDRD